jgi:hypothetical protein
VTDLSLKFCRFSRLHYKPESPKFTGNRNLRNLTINCRSEAMRRGLGGGVTYSSMSVALVHQQPRSSARRCHGRRRGSRGAESADGSRNLQARWNVIGWHWWAAQIIFGPNVFSLLVQIPLPTLPPSPRQNPGIWKRPNCLHRPGLGSWGCLFRGLAVRGSISTPSTTSRFFIDFTL